MFLFLITFISIYGGMHLIAFCRLNTAFAPGRSASQFIVIWFVLMVIAPLLVRLLEHYKIYSGALIAAWPAYIWMGFIFIYCALLLAVDFLKTLTWLADKFLHTGITFLPSSYAVSLGTLLAALLISGYSLYEARHIRTAHFTVNTAKLPSNAHRIRIVQISDVHLGLLFQESRLESVLKAVRVATPDILVSTGDLVDGRLAQEDVLTRMNRMASMIAAIPTKNGKFAIAGNHEFYAGIGPSVDFTRAAGFTVLRNRSIRLENGITISGVDDLAAARAGALSTDEAEKGLLKSFPDDSFHLLLKHRPLVDDTSDGRFDLQLSGHVHKGQIFPFNIPVRIRFPIPCGNSVTPAGSIIHVSRGSGTWGPPMRFLAPPEVTIIDIMPKT